MWLFRKDKIQDNLLKIPRIFRVQRCSERTLESVSFSHSANLRSLDIENKFRWSFKEDFITPGLTCFPSVVSLEWYKSLCLMWEEIKPWGNYASLTTGSVSSALACPKNAVSRCDNIYICSMHFIMPCKLHAVTDVKKAEPGHLFSQREHIIN